MKDDRLYLIHIGECLQRIESYLQGTDREEFLASSLVQDAVLRNLQTLSEATQRLSDLLKENPPAVDWHKIAGFRNVLVHDYLGIDLERVWLVIERDLPLLRKPIKEMLEETGLDDFLSASPDPG